MHNKQGSFVTGVLSAALTKGKSLGTGIISHHTLCTKNFNFRFTVLSEKSFNKKALYYINHPPTNYCNLTTAELSSSSIEENVLYRIKKTF